MVYELGLGFDDCKRGFVAGHLSLPFAPTVWPGFVAVMYKVDDLYLDEHTLYMD